jgi:hypothetical protein
MNYYYYFYLVRVDFSRNITMKCEWIEQSGNKYTFFETSFNTKTIRKKPTIKLFFGSKSKMIRIQTVYNNQEIYANSLRMAIIKYRGTFEERQFFSFYHQHILPYFVYDRNGKQLFSL